MSEDKKYRVIQWATGTVGKAALKHFIRNPVIDLAAVLVFNPAKVGQDAGDIVGLPKTGVLCTDDQEAIFAMEADAVLFSPEQSPTLLDDVCRLLASGKNVISPAGPFLPNKWYPEQTARIEAACGNGGQHYEWTAWCEGKPLVVYHFYWQLGTDLEPLWEVGDDRYRIRILGDPGMEVGVMSNETEGGKRPFLGLPWTGLAGATAVQAVVDAAPGIVSHFDLGIVTPKGMVRR